MITFLRSTINAFSINWFYYLDKTELYLQLVGKDKLDKMVHHGYKFSE